MTASTNLLMAAIDIGSSAIRMDIAEIHADGAIRVLDSLKKGVQLGREAFTEGHLSQETIHAACEALRDFKKVMDTYGVVRYRAVATSAVRESSNRETFLDRLLMSTGLDVEIIDGPEENRLTLTAVMDSLRGELDISKAKSFLMEVGGGSTDIAIYSGGELQQSSTFPLGSIRLRAAVTAGTAKNDQQVRLIKRQITGFVSNLKREMELRDAAHCIALGGDVRFAAKILNPAGQGSRLSIIPKEAFSELVDSLSKLTIDALVQKYSIPYLDAETLVPALLTYAQLFKETQAPNIVISDASIRAGILQDLAPAEQGTRRKRLVNQILSAARTLGRKYHYDESHAERVRELSVRLFDELKTEQRMTETHRLYLEVAALLHDIGLYSRFPQSPQTQLLPDLLFRAFRAAHARTGTDREYRPLSPACDAAAFPRPIHFIGPGRAHDRFKAFRHSQGGECPGQRSLAEDDGPEDQPRRRSAGTDGSKCFGPDDGAAGAGKPQRFLHRGFREKGHS